MYLGNACPWCHRVLLALILRGLLPGIAVVTAADDPERASRGGWVFDSPDPVFGAADLRRALPDMYRRLPNPTNGSGACCIPMLVCRGCVSMPL